MIDEDKCSSLLHYVDWEDLQRLPNKQSFTVSLKSKDGKRIPLASIERYKARTEVISVNYLYLYNETEQGITDAFAVKLKQTTSIEQLQELAKENNCRIGNENEFVKNQYMLYVSKTSELDAMQTANLFYETGLFEFSEPNFVVLNPFR